MISFLLEAVVNFLAVSNNVGDPSPFLAAESARMQELQQSGVFERVLLKADRSGAVVLVNAADQETVRTLVDSLPLVVNGVTRFDITELIDLASTHF